MAAAIASLFLAPCNTSSPLQTGFAFAHDTVTQGGLCVTFDATLGYNAPLTLAPCVPAAPAQAWQLVGSFLQNPPASCGGLNGACISWSGQEFGACTFTPPALGAGCIIGSWPTSENGAWNSALAPDSPAPGMIQALHSTPSSTPPSGLCVAAVPPAPPPPPPRPTADVLAWSKKEVMCLYDIDMCVYSGSPQGCNCADAPPPASAWAPTHLDTDSWVAAGASAGCKIHILVAKHMCGFLAWNSTAGQELGYNYSTAYAASPVDVVAPFVRSVRAAGGGLGMYYSLTNNARTKTCAGVVQPNPAPGQIGVTPAQYDALVAAHLRELWGNYGALDEAWFDGGFSPSQQAFVTSLLLELQPHAVAFNGGRISPNPTRWIGSESGFAPADTWSTCDLDGSGAGSPDAATWYPAETDFTVLQSDSWFFNPAMPVRTPAQLRAMYEQSVGHNTQALIGLAIPPNATMVGTQQAAALAGLGAFVAGCYGAPVAASSGPGPLLTVMPSAPVAIDRVSASEDQAGGQLVRAWVLTATLQDGSTAVLGEGRSIGNKRIVVLPSPLTVASVTLNITGAAGPAVSISQLAIFSCDSLARRLDGE